MRLHVLKQRLAVCRLAPDASLPQRAIDAAFFSVTRTADELSVVLPEDAVRAGWQVEAGWRGFKIEGPLDFAMVGVIARMSGPLADAGIPIFVVSTFDTDYLLVKHEHFALACSTLEAAGHTVAEEG